MSYDSIRGVANAQLSNKSCRSPDVRRESVSGHPCDLHAYILHWLIWSLLKATCLVRPSPGVRSTWSSRSAAEAGSACRGTNNPVDIRTRAAVGNPNPEACRNDARMKKLGAEDVVSRVGLGAVLAGIRGVSPSHVFWGDPHVVGNRQE